MGPEEQALGAHAARVRALPLAEIHGKLVAKATSWGLTESAAEDVVQAAMLRLVRSAGEGWAHEADPRAWRFLLRAVDDARKQASRKGIRRRTDTDTDTAEEAPPSSDPGAQGALLAREQAEWGRVELLRRLQDSPLAVRIIEACIEQGAMTPAELAEALGEPVKRIYTCNERIAREMVRVREAWDARNERATA